MILEQVRPGRVRFVDPLAEFVIGMTVIVVVTVVVTLGAIAAIAALLS